VRRSGNTRLRFGVILVGICIPTPLVLLGQEPAEREVEGSTRAQEETWPEFATTAKPAPMPPWQESAPPEEDSVEGEDLVAFGPLILACGFESCDLSDWAKPPVDLPGPSRPDDPPEPSRPDDPPEPGRPDDPP